MRDGRLHPSATIVGSNGVITTEFLNLTSADAGTHPHGYLPSQMRARLGTTATPFEDLRAETGSGFRFAAEAFAK